MTISLNKITEVNQIQYMFAKNYYSSLLAYRTTNGKYFIKPLTLPKGYKAEIEKQLNLLN